MSGKLIRLFLVDGSPNGIRTVELSNMTIFTTIFPRTKLKDFILRKESNKPGCYILIGEDEKTGLTKLYIGEGEVVKDRLRQHATGASQKEFWNEAIVFTSKDDYITKTQIQYLEAKLYELAEEAEEVQLENNKKPTPPELSEVDTAEMKQFLDVIKLILSSIGITILETKKQNVNQEEKEEEIFTFTIKGARGRMKIEDDRYVVLKGSTAIIEDRPSASQPIRKMRRKLLEEKVTELNEDQSFYVFKENYAFNSPSYAAAAISGGEENGRAVWKYKGKSINEIEAEEIQTKENE